MTLQVGEAEFAKAGGVKVELVNNTTTDRNLVVRVSGLTLKPKTKGATLAEVKVDQQEIPLPKAGIATMTLSLSGGAQIAAGTYAGQLVAYESGGPVVRRAITLNVPGGLPAKPAVKTLTLRTEWWFAGQQWLRQRDVPLDESSGTDRSALNLKTGQVLGYLTGSNGGTARVTWSGTSKLINLEKALALKLNADGFSRPGTYTGTIDLVPADATAGDVTVSAVYTHVVVWPIAALALGILAALFILTITQVYRVVWQLQETLAELGVAFRASQTRFASRSQGKPYATYSIEDAVRNEIKRLSGAIDLLKGPFKVSVDATTLKTAIEEMGKLKQDIDSWAPPGGASSFDIGGFDKDLDELDEALDEIERFAIGNGPPADLPASGAEKDGPNEHFPAFVPAARALLKGHTLGSLAEYRSLHEQVKKHAAFASTWLATAASIQELDLLAERLSAPDVPLDDEDTNLLGDADETLTAAWRELWTAESAEKLAADRTEQDVQDAQQTLYKLSARLPRPAEENVEDVRMGGEPARGRTFGLRRRLWAAHLDEVVEVDYAAQAESYRAQLARWRWALAAVAFVVAVFTGLTALYFGKAWGTATDYATAFLWGLTTQTALTVLVAALAPGPSPLSLPSAPVTVATSPAINPASSFG